MAIEDVGSKFYLRWSSEWKIMTDTCKYIQSEKRSVDTWIWQLQLKMLLLDWNSIWGGQQVTNYDDKRW